MVHRSGISACLLSEPRWPTQEDGGTKAAARGVRHERGRGVLLAPPCELERKGLEREHQLRGMRIRQTGHLARLRFKVERPFEGSAGRLFRCVMDGISEEPFRKQELR